MLVYYADMIYNAVALKMQYGFGVLRIKKLSLISLPRSVIPVAEIPADRRSSGHC